MRVPLEKKSTIDEIRDRFDNEVKRFANLQTGQTATMDAPLAMELITNGAVSSCKTIKDVLDIGCGVGNNTLKLREIYGHDFDVVLNDHAESGDTAPSSFSITTRVSRPFALLRGPGNTPPLREPERAASNATRPDTNQVVR